MPLNIKYSGYKKLLGTEEDGLLDTLWVQQFSNNCPRSSVSRGFLERTMQFEHGRHFSIYLNYYGCQIC